jgi:hypothetical protein
MSLGTERCRHALRIENRVGRGVRRRCGELGEIGRGAAVDFRYWVSVVAQGGGAATAVAEPGGSIAEIDPVGE